LSFLTVFLSSKVVHFKVSTPLNVFLDLQEDEQASISVKKRICFVIRCIYQQN